MIINRSFTAEVLKVTFVVTIIVTSLFIVLRGLIFLGQAVDGLIPVSAVFSLAGLAMLANLDIILPLMIFIALIMVLNRLYADQEIAVLASCGVGITNFLKPLAILNLFFGVIIMFMSFYLTPLALTKGYDLENEYRQSNEVNGLLIGQFVEAKNGNIIYFIESYDKENGMYKNVFIDQNSFDKESVVVASNAYKLDDKTTDDQFLVLTDGTRYEGVPGSLDYRIINFEKYAIRIETNHKQQLHLPIKALMNAEIMYSDLPSYRAQWLWRIAKIFTLPILSIFALGLSFVDKRQGNGIGGVIAFIVYLSYTNLLGYSVALMKDDIHRSSMNIWSVHIFFFIFSIYCLYRRNYNLPLIPNLKLMIN